MGINIGIAPPRIIWKTINPGEKLNIFFKKILSRKRFIGFVSNKKNERITAIHFIFFSHVFGTWPELAYIWTPFYSERCFCGFWSFFKPRNGGRRLRLPLPAARNRASARWSRSDGGRSFQIPRQPPLPRLLLQRRALLQPGTLPSFPNPLALAIRKPKPFFVFPSDSPRFTCFFERLLFSLQFLKFSSCLRFVCREASGFMSVTIIRRRQVPSLTLSFHRTMNFFSLNDLNLIL